MICEEARVELTLIRSKYETFCSRLEELITRDNVHDLLKERDVLRHAIDRLHRRVAPNPYRGERKEVTAGYPEGFTIPSLAEQKARLSAVFPGLDLTKIPDYSSLELPPGADGVVILPKLSTLARLFKVADPYGRGYGELIERLAELLGQQRPFHNYETGVLTNEYVRLNREVKARLTALEEATFGDFLLLPLSFGRRYAGCSPRNAQNEAFRRNQLPLGAVQVSCLLLSLPERLTTEKQLSVHCPADEYNWVKDGTWSYCMIFWFAADQLRLDSSPEFSSSGDSGSAVAFLGAED